MEPLPAGHEVDPNYLAPGWDEKPTCFKCDKAFGAFTRRHHCRNCGHSFCYYCAEKTAPIPKFNVLSGRVCDACADTLAAEADKPWAQDPEYLPEYKDDEKVWTTKEDGEVEIHLSKSGMASKAPQTVFEVFDKAVKNQGDQPALMVERDGEWKAWSYNQYNADVMCAARAMIKLGLARFQAANIIGFNSPEWLISNMASIAAGGKAAGIYTTNGPEACKYISEHSGAAVVVVENEKQLDKFLLIRDDLPKLKALVMYSGELPAGANVDGKVPVYDWKSFMALGNGEDKDELQGTLDKRLADQKPGHCCTLIYTSGTTGNPKAVQISHDNVTWTAQSLITMMPNFGKLPGGEHVVSYLPLSHIAAQMLDIHAPIVTAGLTNGPATVWFARPDALKGSLGTTLKHVRPTMFFGVPRVWEKMEEKMKSIGAANSGLKAAIGSWAKSKGLMGHKAGSVGGDGKLPFGFGLAKSLVFDRIREALGLTRCRAMFTGAAPISPATLDYFGSLNIPICELYGMSECSGPQNVGIPQFRKTGGCGRALPGCEIKIDHVEGRDEPGNGEICFRGRHIMMGYMNNEAKTADTIDPSGFLHSGDVGKLDKDGILYITGRIKELIITAGGENIAPVPIEDKIKTELTALSNVMMVGDKRKYNVALVTCKTAQNVETGAMLPELVGDALKVSGAKTVSEAQADPEWIAYITAGITKVNKTAVSNAQKIQKFVILPEDFSVPNNELTPTLKLKRPIVNKRYQHLIDMFYTDDKSTNSTEAVCKAAIAEPAAGAAEKEAAPAEKEAATAEEATSAEEAPAAETAAE